MLKSYGSVCAVICSLAHTNSIDLYALHCAIVVFYYVCAFACAKIVAMHEMCQSTFCSYTNRRGREREKEHNVFTMSLDAHINLHHNENIEDAEYIVQKLKIRRKICFFACVTHFLFSANFSIKNSQRAYTHNMIHSTHNTRLILFSYLMCTRWCFRQIANDSDNNSTNNYNMQEIEK